MRIVHAVRSDGFAGVERHVAVLARAQQAAGHQVAVIGGDRVSMLRELPRDVGWHPGTTIRHVAHSLVRLRGADVVHAHMTASEAAAAVATRPGTPVVVTRHFGGRRGQSPLGRLVAPLIRRRVSAQIAISRYVAERVDGEATIVYPGVPTPAVSTVPRQPWILAAQRLEAEKGVDVVILAFARAGVTERGWRLVVAGDGALRAGLEELARTEGVAEAVDFLGHRSDIPELMARSSLFISGCAQEGLGLAVVEAMAAGLPVVATASGGHLETVGMEGTEHLFAPGDAIAAGGILHRLVADRSLRQAYGASLREVQQRHFTPEQQERGTRAIYEQVSR